MYMYTSQHYLSVITFNTDLITFMYCRLHYVQLVAEGGNI